MPRQYIVPQFIDAEDKIIGPITLRQFIIMLVVFLVVALLYRLLRFVPFLLTGIPLLIVGGIVAFLKVNGQPFHYFVLNLIQTFKRPRLRVWQKKYSDAELKQYIEREPPEPPEAKPKKERPSGSRLKNLSLLVNTGGVYNPEDYE